MTLKAGDTIKFKKGIYSGMAFRGALFVMHANVDASFFAVNKNQPMNFSFESTLPISLASDFCPSKCLLLEKKQLNDF